jgi:hypothetical protein
LYIQLMAKTKQIAKKLTGGPATQKTIMTLARCLRSNTPPSHIASHSPQVAPDVEMEEFSTSGLVPQPPAVAGTLAGANAGDLGDHGAVCASSDKANDVSCPLCSLAASL